MVANLVNGIVVGSIYALTATGATLVYGILRILDIANAGAFAMGAYAGLLIFGATGSVVGAFLAGMLTAALFGVAAQKWVYVPLLSRPRMVPLIAAIGLFIFLQDLYRLLAGPHVRPFPVRLPFPGVKLGGVSLTAVELLTIGTAGLLLGLLAVALRRTRLGLAWRAAAQDLEIAQAMGVNVGQVVALNFALGYAFAAAAGIMVGMRYNSVFPTMGDVPAYKMLAVIVLGGLGNPAGTAVAGVLLGLIETMVAGYLGFILPRDAIAFAVLIAILLCRPQGLLGRARLGV